MTGQVRQSGVGRRTASIITTSNGAWPGSSRRTHQLVVSYLERVVKDEPKGRVGVFSFTEATSHKGSGDWARTAGIASAITKPVSSGQHRTSLVSTGQRSPVSLVTACALGLAPLHLVSNPPLV